MKSNAFHINILILSPCFIIVAVNIQHERCCILLDPVNHNSTDALL